MTEPVSGSSLPQARETYEHHSDYHHHVRSTDDNDHNHDVVHDSHAPGHQRMHNHQKHIRSHNTNHQIHRRQTSDSVVIVETVSVLQLVDETGATVSVATLASTPTPIPTPTQSLTQPDSTVDQEGDITALDLPSPVPSPSPSDGISGDNASSPSSTVPTIDPTTPPPSESSMPTIYPTLSYSPLTSTPLPGVPTLTFPSISGGTNSTQSDTQSVPTSVPPSISTSSPFSNSNSTSSVQLSASSGTSITSISAFGSSSSAFSSGSTSTSGSASTSAPGSESASTGTTSFASATSSSESFLGTSTSTSVGSDGLPGSGGGGNPAATSGSTPVDSSSTTAKAATTGAIAGGVLGGLAGVALILVAALFLLRYKKRQNSAKTLRDPTADRGHGGLLTGGPAAPDPILGGPSGNEGAGPMTERRRSAPFAIPAALASLSGYNRFSKSTAASDGGERGFAKLSGRKLPPVLQFGGDGYSDPRGTMMSDESIDYRDSQNILGNQIPARLAVGSPMRPDSGIPVFHSGPARTPVAEQAPLNPFTDDAALDPPYRDALGRSHASQDGSNYSQRSGSRFFEDL